MRGYALGGTSRRVMRLTAATAVGASLMLGAVACGDDEEESADTGGATSETAATGGAAGLWSDFEQEHEAPSTQTNIAPNARDADRSVT